MRTRKFDIFWELTQREWVLLLAVIVMLFFASCKTASSQDNSVRTDGLYGYVGTYFEIPVKDGYKLHDVGEIFMDNDRYCVSIVYSRFDPQRNDYDYVTDILSIDQQGNVTYTLEITTMQIVRAVFDQEYAYFAYSNQDILDIQNGILDPDDLVADLVFFDKKTGDTTRVISPGIKADAVFSLTNGFVITGEYSMEKYSANGQLESRVQTEFPLYPHETFVFESESDIYVVTGSGYYKLDFESSKTEFVMGIENMGSAVESFSGPYFFSPKGEYKVNLNDMQIQTMALWNEINIHPKETSESELRYVALDDTHFAIRTTNRDGSGEIGFFTYDNSVNTQRTEIVVGGYDVSSDEAIKWAVYRFNTSNDKYRIVLEDYSYLFPYSTPQEAQSARLKLMRYFNEGNSPDIFYGESFDYQYFGREGMVIDLFSFFEADSEINLSDVIPGVKKVLMPDGVHCYSVFSGFHLSGYYGFKSDFPDNNVSITDIMNLSQSSERSYASEQSSPCIAVESLSYNYQTYWGAYSGAKSITHNEIEKFVSAVIELGIDPSVSWGSLCYLQEVHDGKYYMANVGPIDIFDLDEEEKRLQERITYIGYPSLDGSVHLVRPVGMAGISSSTKYPEQCWIFLRELLLPDIQKKVALSYSIPVNAEVLELMYLCAQDPDSVTDKDMQYFVLGHSAVSEEAVEDFCDIVNSIDTMYTSDWGAYNIISEEILSYYTQDRSIEQIANTLDSRLNLYVQENYT